MQNKKSELRPIAGLSCFREIRTHDGIYVDKTRWMHWMLEKCAFSPYFFVARPWRFGKSLAVSTLECILRGERELFKGLYIDGTDYDWKAHPVLRFSFLTVATENKDAFEKSFACVVKMTLEKAGCSYDDSNSPEVNFERALSYLYERGGQVAVLIDAYDAPIRHSLDNLPLADYIRDRLSFFHIHLKKHNAKVMILFITGEMSSVYMYPTIFSCFYIHNDTIGRRFAGMFGYTDEELDTYFREHMEEHARIMGLPYGKYREELRRWYGGYRFDEDAEPLYHPAAIANVLSRKTDHFGLSWTLNGQTSLMGRYFAREEFPEIREDGDPIYATEGELTGVCMLDEISPIRVLFLSGYLTIESYCRDSELYRMAVPNEEIRRGIAFFAESCRNRRNRSPRPPAD